jgi:hypothetical protein
MTRAGPGADANRENAMKVNVGNADRIARIIAGLCLLSLVFLLDGNARWFGLIGLVPIATGTLRWCPLYAPFGISTCKAEAK